ncbi:hypothetical protein V3C99_006160, partial [Haemonchus contortus]
KSHGRIGPKSVTTSFWNAPMLSNSIRIIVTVGVSLSDSETYLSSQDGAFILPDESGTDKLIPGCRGNKA